MKKLSNTEAELRKRVAYEKGCNSCENQWHPSVQKLVRIKRVTSKYNGE